MGIGTMASDHWGKILVGLATPLTIWLVNASVAWLHSNVVFAADLDKFADKIQQAVTAPLAEIKAQNAKLATQTADNTYAICVAHKNQVKKSVRDLTVQIDAMQADKRTKPQAWTARDQALLDEWMGDLDEQTEDLKRLTC